MPQRLSFPAALGLCIFAGALSAHAACIDVKQASSISFEGTLSYRIYAGPPNYEDVRKGDTPEPTYILTLDTPTCATGDDFLKPDKTFDKIQIYPAETDGPRQGLWGTCGSWWASGSPWKANQRLGLILDTTMRRFFCP